MYKENLMHTLNSYKNYNNSKKIYARTYIHKYYFPMCAYLYLYIYKVKHLSL